MALTMAAAVAVGLGVYERQAGPGRALAVALVGHVTGSVVVALGAGALGRTGWPVAERASANLDYGASMVVAAALGALASRSQDRRVLRVALLGPPLVLLLHHQLADWAHLVACPAGYLVDGARRPRPAVLAGLATAAVTAWLILFGPEAVINSTNEIRFAHAPATGWSLALPHVSRTGTSEAVRDDASGRGRLDRLAYTARALGDRPQVATVYVPAQADRIIRNGGRLPVVVFLHDIPGAPEDWWAGGDLAGLLNQEIAAGRFPPALAVVPESATMHDPKAGWVDAPHQHALQSLRSDLLPALSRRFPAADLATGHMAVVGVGRGADGAVRLARLDGRFRFTVAIRPATGNRWAHWRSELPSALLALTAAGFGAPTGQ